MANKFQVEISAVDKFSKVFDTFGKKAKKAIQPIQDGGDLGGKGVKAFADGLGKISKVTEQMTGRMGGMSLAGIFAGGAAGWAASAAAVAAFSSKYADLSTSVLRTSRVIGMSTDDLQAWTGAARAAGYNADAMTNSLHDLGSVAHAARYGGNNEASMLMAKLGVQPKVGQDGNIDVNNLMEQVTRALSNIQNPYTRAHAQQVLGINSNTGQFLSTGMESVNARRNEVKGTSAVQTRAQLEQAERQLEAQGGLANAAIGVGNSAGSALSKPMEKTMKVMQGKVFDEAVPADLGPDDPDAARRRLLQSGGRAAVRRAAQVEQQLQQSFAADPSVQAAQQAAKVDVHVKVEGGAAKVTAASSNPASAPVRVSNALPGSGP